MLRFGETHDPSVTRTVVSPSSNEGVRIDISLRTPMSFSPSILLVFSVNEDMITGKPASSTSTPLTRQVMINIEVGVNGDIGISNLSGLWPEDDGDANGEREAARMKLCTQIAKVVETCEDFGILVEWILRWMRKNNKV